MKEILTYGHGALQQLQPKSQESSIDWKRYSKHPLYLMKHVSMTYYCNPQETFRRRRRLLLPGSCGCYRELTTWWHTGASVLPASVCLLHQQTDCASTVDAGGLRLPAVTSHPTAGLPLKRLCTHIVQVSEQLNSEYPEDMCLSLSNNTVALHPNNHRHSQTVKTALRWSLCYIQCESQKNPPKGTWHFFTNAC